LARFRLAIPGDKISERPALVRIDLLRRGDEVLARERTLHFIDFNAAIRDGAPWLNRCSG